VLFVLFKVGVRAGSNPEFYDARVTTTGTKEDKDGNVRRANALKKYTFANSKYVLANEFQVPFLMRLSRAQITGATLLLALIWLVIAIRLSSLAGDQQSRNFLN